MVRLTGVADRCSSEVLALGDGVRATAVGADRGVGAFVCGMEVVGLAAIAAKCDRRRGTGGFGAIFLFEDVDSKAQCLIDGIAAVSENTDHVCGSRCVFDADGAFDIKAFGLEFCLDVYVGQTGIDSADDSREHGRCTWRKRGLKGW